MKNNLWKKSALISLIIISLAGCAVGNSVTVARPTLGQEYQDLQKALEKGAITQEEYEQAKEKLRKDNDEFVRIDIDD